MPEHRTRRLFLEMEQIHLLADLAMVALLRFFETREVSLQALLVGPCGAVDALKHFVTRIATPVGARKLGELERAQKARIRHVRAAAHVDVFFVVIQAHRFFVGHVFDQAQLVVLATRLEDRNDFLARCHALDDVVVLLDQLAHACLDRLEIRGSKRSLVGDVVVEPVVDHRADHHLRGRIQLLERMSEQVRERVTDDLETFLVLRRDDLDFRVCIDRIRRIDELAVDLAGHRCFGQPRPDIGSDLSDGGGAWISPLATVWKCNDRHDDEFGAWYRKKSDATRRPF